MPPNNDDSDGTEYGSASNQARIDHYRIPKIPPFFEADPALWFLQVESTLRSAQITASSTKADVVIGALDYEVVSAIRDLIAQTPRPEDIFDQIKKRIISTFAVSAESNLRKLLKGQVLTAGKPSLTLNRLRNLNDGKCDEAIMKSVFMDQLPVNIRAVLAASDVEDVNKLALMADKMAEHSGVAEAQIVSAVNESPSVNPSLADLQSDIKRLTASVESMSVRLKRVERLGNSRQARSTSRPASRSASRSSQGRSGSSNRKPQSLCYAHWKFPASPRSCKEWCEKYASWKSEN